MTSQLRYDSSNRFILRRLISGVCFMSISSIVFEVQGRQKKPSLRVTMASAQVVETSVNTNNSPSQDYTTNPDDHSNHNIDSPGFKPFTVIRNSFSRQVVPVWNLLRHIKGYLYTSSMTEVISAIHCYFFWKSNICQEEKEPITIDCE